MLATYARPFGTVTYVGASFVIPHELGIEIQVCRTASPSIKSFPLPPVIMSEPAPPTMMSPAFQTQLVTVEGRSAVSEPSAKRVQSRALSPFPAVPPRVVNEVPSKISLLSLPDKPSIS